MEQLSDLQEKWYKNIPGIKRIWDEFEGKELYLCPRNGTAGQRINFHRTGVSFCHDTAIENKPREVGLFCDIEKFSPDVYYDAVYNITRDMQNEEFPCRKCPHIRKEIFSLRKISGLITINTIDYCNDSCIYCSAHWGEKGVAYNVIPILKQFVKYDLFNKDLLFDWGGGEPTMNPYYEETVRYLMENGFRQRFNTNSILFSKSTYDALENGRTVLRISVDSGTREGYYRVKGTDNYDAVWNNIKQYRKATDRIYIKYNVCNYNSDKTELDAFLNNICECGIKHIIIDAEIASYQPEKNVGPFYFREKELEAAWYLNENAEKLGMDVSIGSYAFGTRPRYVDGKLALPEQYFDNIDRNVITNDVYLTTFASLEQMLLELKRSQRKVIVWGAGRGGTMVGQILHREKIEYEYVDSDNKRSGECLNGHQIYRAETILKNQENICVILASVHWKSMLKMINESGAQLNGYVYWIPLVHYSKYLENAGEDIK